VTSPSETWAYADRARSITPVETIEVPNGNHALLRGDDALLRGDDARGQLHGARLWHRIAAEFTRASLGLASGQA
jgi:hypothetical protein